MHCDASAPFNNQRDRRRRRQKAKGLKSLKLQMIRHIHTAPSAFSRSKLYAFALPPDLAW
jgi:hypothetical protein